MNQIQPIPTPKIGQCCWRCNKMIFAIVTPNSDVRCAICGNNSDVSLCDCPLDKPDSCYTCNNSELDDVEYCSDCKTIFKFGNTHANNGCSEDIFFGDIVKEYKFKKDEKWIIGTPYFKTDKILKDNLNNMKFKWINKDHKGYCTNASYPKK